MKVTLDSGVKNWLIERGNLITISRYELMSCCVGYEDVDVTYRVPKKGNYEKVIVDGLAIYVEKSLRFIDNHLTISLAGIGPFKHVYIDGLKR